MKSIVNMGAASVRTVWVLCAALLCVCDVSANQTEQADTAAAAPSAAAKPAHSSVKALLASGAIDFQSATAVYNQAIIAAGNIAAVLADLERHAADATLSQNARANALLLASHLQWRDGQSDESLKSIERANDLNSSDEIREFHARLLESRGETDLAIGVYRQLLKSSKQSDRTESIQLKLALIDAGKNNIQALKDLSRKRDKAFRNRAAVALALLDRPDVALELYEVSAENGALFKEHVRLAQWALNARNARAAQTHAWKAVELAPLQHDLRYALSVAIDAYAMDESLDTLLQLLAQRRSGNADEQNARIEILGKLNRYDEALKIFLAANGNRESLPLDTQKRLLQMYRDTGRKQELKAAYERLIAQEPQQSVWPYEYSQYLLEQGDKSAARRMWEEFIGRTAASASLLAAADRMAQLAFDELAVAAAEKCAARGGELAEAAQFFRFDLYVRRGRTAEAEQLLEALNKNLPADSLTRLRVSDGYERLKMQRQALTILNALDSKLPEGLNLDSKTRLARLYDQLGERDKALNIWKAMLAKEIPQSRRRRIQERVIVLGTEVAGLADMIVDQEKKALGPNGSREDLDLLVRLYTHCEDEGSALDAVREYFKRFGNDRKAAIDALKMRGEIYTASKNYAAYGKAYTRLLALDPGDGIDYMQGLILNNIEAGYKLSTDPDPALRGLLEQMQAMAGDAAGAEFQAGVMERAGWGNEAIAIYRLALAAQPAHSDNVLLLTNLLKKTGRIKQAVSALQYYVEAAEQDYVFVVGVDGILNMQANDGDLTRWAERRALERLTTRDDKLYLYEVLSELAESEKNRGMYLSALENSLAHANSRRTNILRELVEATKPNTSGLAVRLSRSFSSPDVVRNAYYSRRLMALGDALPTSVYLTIGEGFISAGDLKSAGEAFKVAAEQTNDKALYEQVGDMLVTAGYESQALAQYEKALILNPDSLSVLNKLANAKDRSGQRAVANDLYLRALTNVVNSQSMILDGNEQSAALQFDDTVNYAYKDHFWKLLTGWLRTLPQDVGAAEPLEALEPLFNAILQETAGKTNGRATVLVHYPRLNVMAQFARVAGLRTGNAPFADAIDRALLKQFPDDEDLLTSAVKLRMNWGLFVSAEALLAAAPANASNRTAGLKEELAARSKPAFAGETSLTALAQQALKGREHAYAIDAFLLAGDQDGAVSAFNAWAADAVAKAQAPLDSSRNGLVGLRWVMLQAKSRLDAQHYAVFCRDIIAQASNREDYATLLLYSYDYSSKETLFHSQSFLLDMENAAGKPFLNTSRLQQLTAKIDAKSRFLLDWQYVSSKLNPEEQIAFLERLFAARSPDRRMWQDAVGVLGAVLKHPLDERLAGRLVAVFKDEIAKAMAQKAGTQLDGDVQDIRSWQNINYAAGMDGSNRRVVNELDRYLAATYPKFFAPGLLKIAMQVELGDHAAALESIADAWIGGYEMYRSRHDLVQEGREADPPYAVRKLLENYAGFIYPKNIAAAMSLVRQREQSSGLTPALLMLGMGLINNNPAKDKFALMSWLEEVTVRNPGNALAASALASTYLSFQYTDKRLAALKRLIDIEPKNLNYRWQLFEAWMNVGNPAEALAAVSGRLNMVLEQRESQVQWQALGRTRPGVYAFKPFIVKYLRQTTAADKDAARLGLRGLLQILPPSAEKMDGSKLADAIDRTYVHGVDNLVGALDSLEWSLQGVQEDRPEREALGSSVEIAKALLRPTAAEQLLSAAGVGVQAPEIQPGADKLLAKLALQDFSAAELQSQIQTFNPNDVDARYPYFKALVDALACNGQLPAEQQRLLAAFDAGTIGNRDLTLLLEILSRQPEPSIKSYLPLLNQRLPDIGGLGSYQQMLIARVYARGGDPDKAIFVYNSNLLSVFSKVADRTHAWIKDRFSNALDIASEAQVTLEGNYREAFFRNLLRIAKREQLPQQRAYFDTFVIAALERGLVSEALTSEFTAVVGAELSKQSIPLSTAAMLIDVLNRQGRHEQALQVLQIVMRNPRAVSPFNDSDYQDSSRYGNALLGANLNTVIRESDGATYVSQETKILAGLFPEAQAWPGAREWNARVAKQVFDWTTQGTVERDLAVRVVAMIALRQQKSGLPEEARLSAEALTKLIGLPQEVGADSATLAMSVLESSGVTVEDATLRALVGSGRLAPDILVPVLQRLAAAKPKEALEVGDLVSAYSQNDGLVTLMAQVGNQSKDVPRVEFWNLAAKRSANAVGAIERREDKQEVAALNDWNAANTPPSDAIMLPRLKMVEIGESIDEMKFEALDGRQVDIKQLRGKVVLIHTWATWCGWCRREVPFIKSTLEKYRDKGFEVIGLNADGFQKRDWVVKHVEENKLSWPQYWHELGSRADLFVRYGLTGGFPIHVLIDQEGKVVSTYARSERLEEKVAELLKNK